MKYFSLRLFFLKKKNVSEADLSHNFFFSNSRFQNKILSLDLCEERMNITGNSTWGCQIFPKVYGIVSSAAAVTNAPHRESQQVTARAPRSLCPARSLWQNCLISRGRWQKVLIIFPTWAALAFILFSHSHRKRSQIVMNSNLEVYALTFFGQLAVYIWLSIRNNHFSIISIQPHFFLSAMYVLK